MLNAVEGDEEALVRPAGGGKMTTGRGRKDNAKPYDRSSSSSMFGRFCSSVKGLLMPSYFTDADSRFNMKPENGGGIDSVLQRNEIAGGGRGKRDEVANLLNKGSYQTALTGRENNDNGANLVNADSNQDALSCAIPLSKEIKNTIESFQRQLPELTLESPVINHSSGGKSARYRRDSRSATDDVVKLYQPLRTSHPDLNESDCSESSSSASVTMNKFETRPTTYVRDANVSRSNVLPDRINFLWSSEHMDAKKKVHPSFDVSSFRESVDQTCHHVTKITPAKQSVRLRVDGESLFYPGPTTYGGAAASTLKTYRNGTSSPYQRRGAVQQCVTAKPSGALGGTGITSATSRRILDAMQRGEDSRASVRYNLRSRDPIASTFSLTNASSTSIFHRHSAQFDATVSRESLLANGLRAVCSASEVNRNCTSPPYTTVSSNVMFNNPDIDQMIKASENIREHPQESVGKIKKAPKHYSCRDDDDVPVGPNPILCNIQPLPTININPGLLLGSTTAVAKSSVNFSFSMPKENIAFETKSLKPNPTSKVPPPMSVLNHNAQFRMPLEVDNTNTLKIKGAKSSSSMSISTSNLSETVSLHSVMSFSGSKSVTQQSSSQSIDQGSISNAGFFNATNSGGFKVGFSSTQFEQSDLANNQSNHLTLKFSESGHNEEELPIIIQDNLLLRPPLRDAVDVSSNSLTSEPSNVEVSKSPSSPEKVISVSKISSVAASTRESNANTNEASTDVPVPLSQLFKKPTNVWTCNECYVTNKSDATVCVSCDSARPGHEQSSLPTIVQDATTKPIGTSALFTFGTETKDSVASESKTAVVPGFRPTSGLLPLTSTSTPFSSSFGGTGNTGSVEKPPMFGSLALSTNASIAPVFSSSTNNVSVSTSLFSNSLNSTSASSMFGNNVLKAVSSDASFNINLSNPIAMFGNANTSAVPTFGAFVSSSSNAAPMFNSMLNVASASTMSSDKNVSFSAPTMEIASSAGPASSAIAATAAVTSGFNFGGGFSCIPNNPISASVVNDGQSISTPKFSFPTHTTSITTSLFPPTSAVATSTTTNSSKFNYTPSAPSIFGTSPSSSSTNFVPKFGMPANTTTVLSQFGASATPSAANTGMFPVTAPNASAPFFGSGPSTLNTPMFGMPATSTPSSMFGAPEAAPEKTSMFGASNGTPGPMFGQASNPPMFGQVQQPTMTPAVPHHSSAPFMFGAAPTTTNTASVFQMPSTVVASPFFGMQSSVAPAPSGFGASAFATPTFGAAKNDAFSATPGFGAPSTSLQFGASNGISSAVPKFGAGIGATSAFGLSSNSNGQPGAFPTFGAAAPTNGPSVAFGNGMQNSQTASNMFAFGGGVSGNQLNDSAKIASSVTGHSNKRGLDDGTNNDGNSAKRSGDMFGNQNPNSFAFGSGQQPAVAPVNVWNQQQSSAATNNNANAFSTTQPAAGFNFASAASQFNFPAAPTNNPGGVFQFGMAAKQPQSAPNPFGNSSNVAQNPFNVNAANPFDVASANPQRVIKKAVRKTIPRR